MALKFAVRGGRMVNTSSLHSSTLPCTSSQRSWNYEIVVLIHLLWLGGLYDSFRFPLRATALTTLSARPVAWCAVWW